VDDDEWTNIHAYSVIRTPQSPIVIVEWLTLLLRNREVPVSNLGPATGYADRDFIVFFLSPSRRMLA
jgi:hypothetical protein